MTENALSPNPQFVLTIACPDRPGIVAAVASFLLEHDGNILQSQQFNDLETTRFFLRVQFEVLGGTDPSPDALRSEFGPLAGEFGMGFQMWNAAARYRTLIMVSRYDHCLQDLLYRWRKGSLLIDIPAIVSNHADLEPLAKAYAIPYHHIPVSPATKADAEARLLSIVDDLGVHLVVLARYMQILSDETTSALSGKAINIHHSFLPSFKGVRPYHQAHDRGVKLIGATAHYVTSDLDEGPIIEQDVARVDHSLSAAELAAVGRDVESTVLSRAVRWHSETRILLNGNKTVVLR
jgi:formyltetrahydrofolate deformylase